MKKILFILTLTLTASLISCGESNEKPSAKEMSDHVDKVYKKENDLSDKLKRQQDANYEHRLKMIELGSPVPKDQIEEEDKKLNDWYNKEKAKIEAWDKKYNPENK